VISNNRQLNLARERLEQLLTEQQQSADALERRVYAQLASDVMAEIHEYEAISTGDVQCFNVAGADDLGKALIRARISRGWSQTRLSEALGVTPQMVQKDESREYENCGLARFAEILDILGFELVGAVRRKFTARRNPSTIDRSSFATSSAVESIMMGSVPRLSPVGVAGGASTIAMSAAVNTDVKETETIRLRTVS
jgi:hypothetical protein